MIRLRPSIRFLLIATICIGIGGCRSAAPIHVWNPPRLASAVNAKVAIAPIRGQDAIAQPLGAAMLRLQPRDAGRAAIAIDARRLQSNDSIRLVTAVEGETSDIALMTLARRNDIDFVLVGEVIETGDRRRRSQSPSPEHNDWVLSSVENTATDASSDDTGLIRVSWSLVDVRRGVPLSGLPVVTPGNPRQPDEQAIELAAEKAWELLVPHLVRDKTELAHPRLALGASDIRKGNAAAAAGDWQAAEQHWQAVLSRHRRSHAAKHNLAVAAVARQDYAAARMLIAEALAWRALPLYRDTAVWIEQSQRDYHAAFGLPDPPEGWAATRR